MDNTPAPDSQGPIIAPTVIAPDQPSAPATSEAAALPAEPITPEAPATPESAPAVDPSAAPILPTVAPSEPAAADSSNPVASSETMPAAAPTPPMADPTAVPPPTAPAPVVAPLPDVPPVAPAASAAAAAPHRPLPLKLIGFILAGLVLLTATSAISYAAGKHAPKPMAAPMTTAAFTVPAGATIIEQCSPGLGTQYVLPKDIPGGPVYNVYQGKLIGVEYMEDLTSMEKLNTMLTNLPLFGQSYDHINIMSMPAHAGMPTPHYQVDIMMVSAATAAKITCSSPSASMSNMNSSASSSPSSKM